MRNLYFESLTSLRCRASIAIKQISQQMYKAERVCTADLAIGTQAMNLLRMVSGWVSLVRLTSSLTQLGQRHT